MAETPVLPLIPQQDLDQLERDVVEASLNKYMPGWQVAAEASGKAAGAIVQAAANFGTPQMLAEILRTGGDISKQAGVVISDMLAGRMSWADRMTASTRSAEQAFGFGLFGGAPGSASSALDLRNLGIETVKRQAMGLQFAGQVFNPLKSALEVIAGLSSSLNPDSMAMTIAGQAQQVKATGVAGNLQSSAANLNAQATVAAGVYSAQVAAEQAAAARAFAAAEADKDRAFAASQQAAMIAAAGGGGSSRVSVSSGNSPQYYGGGASSPAAMPVATPSPTAYVPPSSGGGSTGGSSGTGYTPGTQYTYFTPDGNTMTTGGTGTGRGSITSGGTTYYSEQEEFDRQLFGF